MNHSIPVIFDDCCSILRNDGAADFLIIINFIKIKESQYRERSQIIQKIF